MNDLNYVHLGRLSLDLVEQFKTRIQPKITTENYQWVHFDEDDTAFYKSVLNHPATEFLKPNQKAIVSAPGYGFRIHKDEPNVQCALNVVVQCNSTDWVRWYDEDYINSIAEVELIDSKNNDKPLISRNIHIKKYGPIPFIDELSNQQPGDVYLVNTDKYHSFRAVGYNHRIVIQTKFTGYPSIGELATHLKNNIFSNYIL
jgi:hypothetical protein